jgi:hypothetical protein
MPRRRSAEFGRRSALYGRLDAQLRDCTRFFAAAALINAVLARLFELLPLSHGRQSFHFLSEVGAALEVDNLDLARRLPQHRVGGGWDRTLVCAEQGQLQQFVLAHQRARPEQWRAVRRELNGLLNERHAAAFFPAWCDGSGRILRVLREVRDQLGTKLDFAAQSHRIHIGLALIDCIRREAAASV